MPPGAHCDPGAQSLRRRSFRPNPSSCFSSRSRGRKSRFRRRWQRMRRRWRRIGHGSHAPPASLDPSGQSARFPAAFGGGLGGKPGMRCEIHDDTATAFSCACQRRRKHVTSALRLRDEKQRTRIRPDGAPPQATAHQDSQWARRNPSLWYVLYGFLRSRSSGVSPRYSDFRAVPRKPPVDTIEPHGLLEAIREHARDQRPLLIHACLSSTSEASVTTSCGSRLSRSQSAPSGDGIPSHHPAQLDSRGGMR